jgi:hypothetical protein
MRAESVYECVVRIFFDNILISPRSKMTVRNDEYVGSNYETAPLL